MTVFGHDPGGCGRTPLGRDRLSKWCRQRIEPALVRFERQAHRLAFCQHALQFARGPGADIAPGTENGGFYIGLGQIRAVAHLVSFALQAGQNRLQASENIQVGGADILFALAVVVVENRQPFLGVGFAAQTQPGFDARDDAPDGLFDGLVEVNRFAALLIVMPDLAGKGGRFTHSGHLGDGDGPDHLQRFNADGIPAPFIDGARVKVNGVQDGNIQINQGPAQIVVDGGIEFEAERDHQRYPGLPPVVEQQLCQHVAIAAETGHHIEPCFFQLTDEVIIGRSLTVD